MNAPHPDLPVVSSNPALNTRPALRALLAGLMLLALAACAHRPPASDPVALAAYEEADDPLEPFNRAMFSADQKLDKVFVRPITAGYRAIVPAGGRLAINRFVDHLRSPVTFINDVLQGEISRAGTTLGRIVVNTGVGFFGFFDVAEKWGMPGHTEDFGQTLAVWGMDSGPYVYVPLLGPNTARDGIGFTIDSFFVDPISWYSYGDGSPAWVQWAYFGLTYVDTKDSVQDVLDELKKSSIDYYAALRSSYRQIRASEIRNGAAPPMEDIE